MSPIWNYLTIQNMDYEIMGIVLLALLFLAAWALATDRIHRRLQKLRRLPPGPFPWPVVGNLFQVVWTTCGPHQLFAKLAEHHGPIMTLHLGCMTTVVISSSEVARVMFKKHDTILAGRKIYESLKGDMDNEGSIITSQYGPHWRMMRRMCTTEFFATGRLDAMRGVRAKCIGQMVQFIRDDASRSGGVIDIGRFFFVMAFNLFGNLMFSKDLLDPKSERGAEFFYHAGKVVEYGGKPNVADFLPWLRWIDPQNIQRRTQFHIKKAFDVAGEFLKERLKDMENNGCVEKKRRDYLDVLLQYRGDGVEGPPVFSSTNINIIVFEMFSAGSDTTTNTLEWAMAELLHNPHTLQKVQTELRTAVGLGANLEEEKLEQLPYLNAVIKETLRLHPPLPFLVPHMAMDSCEMLGYHIPKETQILVNAWAIGRDPANWKEPLEFKPERFLEPNEADYKGHHFEFIPFGSGRRMCPALPLVSRLVPLALGSVLYFFDWVLAVGMKPGEMDMSEIMGITLKKAVPLKIVPVPHTFSDE